MGKRFLPVLAGLSCLALVLSVARAPERELANQPFPDAQEYADSARSLARGDGFFTYIHEGTRQPPRYPPGYPMALSPFAATGAGVQSGAKTYAVIYALVAVLAAWALGGPLAAIIVSLLVGFSPFAQDAAGLVMSDALVATLTVMVLPLLASPTRSAARLAGATAGLAAITRLAAGVNLIALVVAWPGKSLRTMALYALPALVVLGLLQWVVFGSPLKTGYDYWNVSADTFALDYAVGDGTQREGPFILPDRLEGELLDDLVCPCPTGGSQIALPNITFYPLVLLGVFWIYSPPLIPLLGLLYAWRRRRDPVGRYALAVTALTLLMFVFYRFQGGRFMAGAATTLTVLAGVWIAELAGSLWRRRAAEGQEQPPLRPHGRCA